MLLFRQNRTHAASLNHGALEYGQAEETSTAFTQIGDADKYEEAKQNSLGERGRSCSRSSVRMKHRQPGEMSGREEPQTGCALLYLCLLCFYCKKTDMNPQLLPCFCPSHPPIPRGIDHRQSPSSPFSPMPLDHTEGLPSLYVFICTIHYTYRVCHIPA